MRHIHLSADTDAYELVHPGRALCKAGWTHRTEDEQHVTAIYDDVTCKNCQRIVRAENQREDTTEGRD